MSSPNIVSPDDQKVTFVELFFDLVFVFSVTQVVRLLHDGITPATVGQAVLVFWLVWWAWTQFTWALNAADTTHHSVGLATLAATGIAFFMAIAVPDAFHGRAGWFAVPYVLIRGVGLTLYGRVAAAAAPEQLAAVRTFCLFSLGGIGAVLTGGFIGGAGQYWLWGFAILLDVIAAGIAGRHAGWDLHPEHFAERYGLFVIIALGESLIVAAGGVTGAARTSAGLLVAVLAVAVTCALWWTYFARVKPLLDHALERARHADRSQMGRDVFSLLHFPMLCGVIAYAAAIEAAVAHPEVPLVLGVRLALGSGLALFVGGMAVALWRATRRVLRVRLVLCAALAVLLVVWGGAQPALSMAVAFAVVTAIGIREQRVLSTSAIP